MLLNRAAAIRLLHRHRRQPNQDLVTSATLQLVAGFYVSSRTPILFAYLFTAKDSYARCRLLLFRSKDCTKKENRTVLTRLFLSTILQRHINQEDISRFRWRYPACSDCRQDKYFCLALKSEKHQKGNDKSKQRNCFCKRKA